VTSIQAIEQEMERQASASEFSAQIALLLARERAVANKAPLGAAPPGSGNAPCAARANCQSDPPSEERK
jgi:hypothetical protein